MKKLLAISRKSSKETISVNYTLVCCNHRNEKGSYFSINTPKDKAGTRIIPMTEKVSRAKILLGRCLLPIV